MVSRPTRDRKAPTTMFTEAASKADLSLIAPNSDEEDSDTDSDSDAEVNDENNESTNTVKTIKTKSKPKAKTSKPAKAKSTAPLRAGPAAKLAKGESNVLVKALLDKTVSITTVTADLITQHATDPNTVHCALINLLFRAVGGTAASSIDATTFTLDDINDNDWVTLITNVVADMQNAVGGSIITVNKKAVGAAKKNVDAYKQFWFELADAALTQGAGAIAGKGGATAARLDVSLVGEFVARVTELVGVGQPDIRYAASLAAFEMSRAVMSRMDSLDSKLAVAERQKATSTGKRADSLASQITSFKAAIASMADLVSGPVFAVVFMHRYRDSNPVIRALCLEYLATACVVRPNLFLSDKYLKYFGWHLSDKSSIVRAAALTGLNRPFVVANSSADAGIDLDSMTNVTMKFLKRIADCAVDVDVSVQPCAMTLLLSLLKEGFLDEMNDETTWDQINFRAMDPSATPEMRATATEFIIEQLEEFDDDEEAEGTTGVAGGDAERTVVKKIDSLASWIAHSLTGGEETANLDTINLEYTDLFVASLKSINDHAYLATEWSAMLRAINEDSVATTANNNTADSKTDAAKQLVLMRMLMAAVKMEVSKVSAADFLAGVDFAKTQATKKNDSAHTKLSVEVLKALPALLKKFSGDSRMLREIATLPRYLIHSVFSVANRKTDFQSTVKALADLYVKSADEQVSVLAAMSLQHMISGDHARVNDARSSVQKIVDTLTKKITDLVLTKTSTTKMKGKGEASADTEFALGLALKQLRVLGKYCNVADMIGQNDVESFLEAVAECSKGRVADSKGDNQVLAQSAVVVSESMDLINSVLGWRLAAIHEVENHKMEQDEEDDMKDDAAANDDDSADTAAADSTVVIRDLAVAICQDVFDLKAEGEDDEAFGMKSESISDFAVFKNAVQTAACLAASDLRTLCSKSLKDSASKVLRAAALENDAALLAGMAKFVKKASKGSADFVPKSLLPVARCLVANWEFVNRREAGIVLANITGSGQDASKLVAAMAKLAKNKDGVKLLEAHMASLRQSYEDWQESTPEQLEDKASEEEMEAYEAAEETHEEQYGALRTQASRLSSSLGVGKLSNRKMEPAMVGFVKEGLRYAFSCPKKGSEDDQEMYGDRLSFLGPLKMYLNWVKKNAGQKKEVLDGYVKHVKEFKAHLFFNEAAHAEILEVFGGDFEAMIKEKKGKTEEEEDVNENFDMEEEDVVVSGTESKRKSGADSSVSSASKGSSNLESVKESEEGNGDEWQEGMFDKGDKEDSPPKRRRSSRG